MVITQPNFLQVVQQRGFDISSEPEISLVLYFINKVHSKTLARGISMNYFGASFNHLKRADFHPNLSPSSPPFSFVPGSETFSTTAS